VPVAPFRHSPLDWSPRASGTARLAVRHKEAVRPFCLLEGAYGTKVTPAASGNVEIIHLLRALSRPDITALAKRGIAEGDSRCVLRASAARCREHRRQSAVSWNVAASDARSSTTSTRHAPSTRYAEIPRVKALCERYELPNSGPFLKQLGMVQRTILRNFPGGKPHLNPATTATRQTRSASRDDATVAATAWRDPDGPAGYKRGDRYIRPRSGEARLFLSEASKRLLLP
jgi:hypothetical protein